MFCYISGVIQLLDILLLFACGKFVDENIQTIEQATPKKQTLKRIELCIDTIEQSNIETIDIQANNIDKKIQQQSNIDKIIQAQSNNTYISIVASSIALCIVFYSFLEIILSIMLQMALLIMLWIVSILDCLKHSLYMLLII